MNYAIYITESFEREIEDLSKADKEIIEKIYEQLKENPYVGDQIRYKFFREKRLREKRVYYLVYDDLLAVLIVAIGGKKIQKETIEEIIKMLPEFRRFILKQLS